MHGYDDDRRYHKGTASAFHNVTPRIPRRSKKSLYHQDTAIASPRPGHALPGKVKMPALPPRHFYVIRLDFTIFKIMTLLLPRYYFTASGDDNYLLSGRAITQARSKYVYYLYDAMPRVGQQ